MTNPVQASDRSQTEKRISEIQARLAQAYRLADHPDGIESISDAIRSDLRFLLYQVETVAMALRQATEDVERLNWLEQKASYASRFTEPAEGHVWCVAMPDEFSDSGIEHRANTAREAIDAAKASR